MKASKYNFFIEADDGKILAYNALSGAFTCIDRDSYNECLQIFSNPDIMAANYAYDSQKDPNGIMKDLQKGRFLIADTVDEIVAVGRIEHEMKYMQDDLLSVIIAPTMHCNFNCVYCFENDNKSQDRMTRETAGNIIKYIDESSAEGGVLRLHWFGGEPTLALDTIYYISEEIQKIVFRKNIQLVANINTNGYLLDKKTAEMLKSRGITEAIITLDGCAEEHNKRRPLRNGKGSFDKILSNLKDICGIMSVIVGYSVDRDNIDEFSRLLDLLEESGITKKIRMQVVMIEAYEYSSEPVKEKALSVHEFSDVFYELTKKIVERGITVDFLPPPGRTVCTAQLSNHVVIGPRGDLFKCLHTAWRPDEAFGNINQPVSRSNNRTKWQDIYLMDNDKCRSCKILPLCMGGCARNTLVKETCQLYADGCCTHFKYNIENLIKLLYLQKRMNAEVR